jgi:predicted phosphodiesterase
MRSWQGWADGDSHWLYYYKARFQPRSTHVGSVDLSDLVNAIGKDRRASKLSTGDAALVVNLSDWQTGKRDGDGTLGLIGRVRQAIIDLRGRVRDLKRMGIPVGVIYVAGVGDMVEGCDNFYAMQSFTVELNRRDQVKLARRLSAEIIRAASKLAERVVVVAVAGNHGENRKDGKAFTDLADNDDVALFEQIAEAFAENPDAYGHVSFVIPNDELTVTLDVCGTLVTWAHGHQFGGGATAEKKAKSWLADQALGKHAPGDCDLLISGHYHHLCVAQWGAVGWVQVPALDGGSDWWRNTTGEHSPPGMASRALSARFRSARSRSLGSLGRHQQARARHNFMSATASAAAPAAARLAPAPAPPAAWQAHTHTPRQHLRASGTHPRAGPT